MGEKKGEAMRREYEMTDEQYRKLLEACRPTPAMWESGGVPLFNTPQENANAAWAALGHELGFKPMTVRAVRPELGKSDRCFTAEPCD